MNFEIIAPDSKLPDHYDQSVFSRLEPGQRLLVVLQSGIHLAHVLIECFERGIVCIPIDPRSPNEKIEFILKHSEAHAIYSEAEGLKITNASNTSSHPNDRWIIYTSGSTGNPKGIIIRKEAAVANAMATAKLHKFHHTKTHATALPLFHCNALVMSLLGCHLTKNKLVLFCNFEPDFFFKTCEKHQVYSASLVPALLTRLTEKTPSWPETSNYRLQYIITAAASLSRNLAQDFYKLYGPRLRQGYGLSEAVNFSFISPLMNDEEFQKEYIDNHPPVGLPLEGTQAKLLNGEVLVTGPNLMQAYLKNHEETNKTFHYEDNNTWIRTGDLGEWRGKYLVLKSRLKEVINRGGSSINPAEVEENWLNCGLEQPFCSVSIENNYLNEDIGLCFYTTDFDELDKINQTSFKPSAVESSPLIQTSTGKPQRLKMGKQLFSRSDSSEQLNEWLNVMSEFGATFQESKTQQLSKNSKGLVKTIIDYQNQSANNFNAKKNLWKEISQYWPLCVYSEMLDQFKILRQSNHSEVATYMFEPFTEQVINRQAHRPEATEVYAFPGDHPYCRFFYSLFNVQQDHSIYWSRKQWLKNKLIKPDMKWGYSVFRAGKHDLGGLVWTKV